MDDLNPDVRQVISDRMQAAQGVTGDYDKALASGAVKEFKPINDFGLSAEQSAIGNMAKARFYDPAIESIKMQQRANYAGEAQKKLRDAQQLGLGQLRYDSARALAARQRVAQEEAQRAAMIGNLFQIGGMAAGFAFGGPAGAAIGGAAGGAMAPQSPASSGGGLGSYQYGNVAQNYNFNK